MIDFNYQLKVFRRGLGIVSLKIAKGLVALALVAGFTYIASLSPGLALAIVCLFGLFVWIMITGEDDVREDFWKRPKQ